MQGPSLDAIRRVKEQLELRKREDEERKAKDRLNILEHRAAQGDRRAKTQLKVIEKVKEERSKPADEARSKHTAITASNQYGNRSNLGKKPIPAAARSGARPRTGAKGAIMDFDELMKLAEQNKNPKPAPPPPSEEPPTSRNKQLVRTTTANKPPVQPRLPVAAAPAPAKKPAVPQAQMRPSAAPVNHQPPPAAQRKPTAVPQGLPRQQPPHSQAIARKATPERAQPVRPMKRVRPDPEEIQSAEVRAQLMRLRQMRAQQQQRIQQNNPRQNSYAASHRYAEEEEDDYGDDYSDYDDEDRYEQDDFVVDDDEDDVQNEISRTIRSVFKYDKSRCDARERELELEYQRIGNVSTFEDLEREERRAARLGAAEDAQAEREEEERKRRKKQRRLERSRR